MSEERNHMFKSWLEAALYYRSLGLSPIPLIRNTKKAIVPWKKYQEAPPSEEKIHEWSEKYSDCNIGLVTGQVSGLLVIDIDAGHEPFPPLGFELQSAYLVETPGGIHAYYRYIKGIRKSTSKLARGIDVLSEGCCVVAPPSVIDDKPYRIKEGSLEEALKIHPPKWLYQRLIELQKKRSKRKSRSLNPGERIPEGQRNTTLFEIGCDMRKQQFNETDLSELLAQLNESQCDPPLPDEEVKQIAKNASKEPERKYQRGRNNSISQAEELTRLFEAEIEEYFQDQFGDPHICMRINDHYELWKVSQSRSLKAWIAGFYRDLFHDCVASCAINQTIQQIIAKCLREPRRELFNRVAWHHGKLYYDLTTMDYEAVEITGEGWRITKAPPIFRRYPQQIPQVKPVRGGNINKIWKYVNVADHDRLLFLAVTGSWMFPDIPHPIMVNHGQPGSGKSTILRTLKRIIDPSASETEGIPRKEEDVVLIFDYNWLICFDNLYQLKPWLSDMLCRGVTGEGRTSRLLFTNSDVVLRQYRRCFALNGIVSPATRDDLLDRSVLIGLEKIEQKRSETAMMAEWKEVLPEILGCLFDAVSQAIRILPTIQTNQPYRMADFARVGMALSPGFGFTAEEFIAAYDKSIDSKWLDSVESSPFSSAVISCLDYHGKPWEATATDIARELEPYARQEGRQKPLFSIHPRWVASELMRIAPALENYGILVERLPYKRIGGVIQRKVFRISRREWLNDE